ncbi:small GTPase superfamily, partial [Mycena vulgaris]
VKLQCWDTAGTKSFRSLFLLNSLAWLKSRTGCLLVYDVTSHRSFESVRNWLADVRAHADAHISSILLGNKVDLCD